MNKFLKLSVVIATLSLSSAAFSAGYQLNEYSATGMGRSFAGVGVVGDDFSAIGYNPAGMTYNETNGVQATASYVRLYSHFKDKTAGSTERGQTDINRVLPGFFAQHHFSDKLTTGIGVYTPFGLATDYPNGWFGERHGGLSEITVMNISPSIAYQLNDYVSVGGSVNFQNAEAHLTSSSADLEGDDWAVGYTLGLTVTPIKPVRIGLSYRSKVSHKLKGDINRLTVPSAGHYFTFNGGDVSAKITTPETATLSAAWDVNDKWTLSGTARWTRWKRFDTLNVNLMNPVIDPITSSTQEKWRNTGFYALGADYKWNDQWTVRAGLAYDMTVIRSAGYRTPRIPDGRRVWNSIGVSYAHKNFQVDFGYAHIYVFGGHAKGTDNLNLNQGNRPNIKYSSDANMFSLGLQYKF